jgi:hypothetical protein
MSDSTSFLRDASMNRLGMKLQNKKEEIMNPLSTQHLSIAKLTSSGLNTAQQSLIRNWVNGKCSGRTCLFNLLTQSGDIDPLMENQNNKDGQSNVVQSHTESVALLARTVHLPTNVITALNSGYLYQQVFAAPPRNVLRTAIQLVRERALDQVRPFWSNPNPFYSLRTQWTTVTMMIALTPLYLSFAGET